MQVAANVARARRAAAARREWAPRAAPAGTTGRRASGRQRPRRAASGSGSSASTYAGEPVARTSAVPNRRGSATTSSTGTPSTVTPTACRSPCSTTATIWGSEPKRASTAAGSGAAQTTARRSQESRHLRTSPAASPSRAAATPATSSRARFSSSPWRGCGLGLAAERLEQPRLGLRPDTRHGPQPARGRSLAELVGGAHAERPRELDRALRPQAEIAAEPDEVRRELALELRQLGDVARLDELPQPGLDPRPDPAQLTRPPGPHQLRDGHRRAADRLGGAAIRAHRVRVAVGELEQGPERVQAVGDLAILHRSARLRLLRPSHRRERERTDSIAFSRLAKISSRTTLLSRSSKTCAPCCWISTPLPLPRP